MDSGDKATNKAMSAAYKYAAMQAFAIPTEGDNDADSTTHEVIAAPRTTSTRLIAAANLEVSAERQQALRTIGKSLIDLVDQERSDMSVDNRWTIWQ